MSSGEEILRYALNDSYSSRYFLLPFVPPHNLRRHLAPLRLRCGQIIAPDAGDGPGAGLHAETAVGVGKDGGDGEQGGVGVAEAAVEVVVEAAAVGVGVGGQGGEVGGVRQTGVAGGQVTEEGVADVVVGGGGVGALQEGGDAGVAEFCAGAAYGAAVDEPGGGGGVGVGGVAADHGADGAVADEGAWDAAVARDCDVGGVAAVEDAVGRGSHEAAGVAAVGLHGAAGGVAGHEGT